MCKYDERCQNGLISEGNFKVRKCECIRDKKVEFYYKRSGAPLSHFKGLDDLKKQDIITGTGNVVGVKAVIKQLTDDRKNIDYMIEDNFRIVLKGNTGSGKSQTALTLAVEITKRFELNAYKDEPNKFYFLSMSHLKENIFNDKEKTEIQKKVKNSQVLIIDDLGVEIQHNNNKVSYILEFLNDVVRSFSGLIIITTNLEGDIRDIYGAHNKRLASVLVSADEAEHGQTNNLFYEITVPEDRNRRKQKNTRVKFL